MQYLTNEDDKIRFKQLLEHIPQPNTIIETYLNINSMARIFCFNNNYKIHLYLLKNEVDKSFVSYLDFPVINLINLCTIQTFLTLSSPHSFDFF